MLCYLFSFYLHVWNSPTQRITPHHLLIYVFQNSPWEFSVGNCHKILPWLFATRICRRNFPSLFPWNFCICKQMFFLYMWANLVCIKQTFFICEQKFFSCDIFFINLTVFHFVIAMAVMGHHTYTCKTN